MTAAAAEEPMSVIDWLSENPQGAQGGTVLLEPPVAETALGPAISVRPLDAVAPPVGLVPPDVTGLPPDLWHWSDAAELARLIRQSPVLGSAAMQSLLYTLLLTETQPPPRPGAPARMIEARIDKLMQLGAADPAQALAEQAGPSRSPALFRQWFDATLLTGDEARSCATLRARSNLAPSYGAVIFCAVRAGDWPTATLLFDNVRTLELLPPDQIDLLDRFLYPDFFEGAPPLPAPDMPTPLTFRLFEAIGERLPTADLPRAFATADLRDVAGWKAQLEAAERLTRTGALSGNRLLGLYTARRPAASGGIWDRVAALQRFETALDTGSPDAVAKTLPVVWSAMRDAGLEVAFAGLFADRLSAVTLDDPQAQDLAWRIGLLSPGYRDLAAPAPAETPETAFLTTLAQSTPDPDLAPDAQARAIAQGLQPDAPTTPRIEQLLQEQKLGEAMLQTIALFDRGAGGDLPALSKSVAAFGRMGLTDTARRAALELLLLGTS